MRMRILGITLLLIGLTITVAGVIGSAQEDRAHVGRLPAIANKVEQNAEKLVEHDFYLRELQAANLRTRMAKLEEVTNRTQSDITEMKKMIWWMLTSVLGLGGGLGGKFLYDRSQFNEVKKCSSCTYHPDNR